MAYLESQLPASRTDWLRWSSCAVLVLAAHALIVLVISWRPEVSDLEAGAPMVMIELAPIPVAPPVPPSELAPGPQQTQAENEDRAREEAKPELKDPDPVQKYEEMPAENPLVALPPPVPKPAEQPAQLEQKPTQAAPVPTAPPAAEAPASRPAAPPAGSNARTAAELASWQRQLVNHLQHFKRYPPQANGQQGIASLAFRIDRHGRLVSAHLLRSSGSGVLDAETLALIKRADPLPAPPAAIADHQLSFVVPIRYAASGPR
jgi:periplasmic protein TonB